MLPRTRDCFEKIEADAKLDYCLPAKGALPGHVLKHSYSVVERHLERASPMTYKIGYTHDAYCRFYNSKYGYCTEWRNRWEGMVVVYASPDTVSASFVEAAMIQRFMGTLSARVLYCIYTVVRMLSMICDMLQLYLCPLHQLRHARLQE